MCMGSLAAIRDGVLIGPQVTYHLFDYYECSMPCDVVGCTDIPEAYADVVDFDVDMVLEHVVLLRVDNDTGRFTVASNCAMGDGQSA